MCTRYNEYVTPEEIRIGCATYNVNGGKHFRSVVYKDVSLTDWLLDAHTLARSRCKRFRLQQCFSLVDNLMAILSFSFGRF